MLQVRGRGLWIIRLPCSEGYTLFLLISTKLHVREWQASSQADRLQVQFVYSTLSLQADTRCTQVYMHCDLAIPTKTNVFVLLFLCRDVCVFVLFLSVSLQCKDHHGVLSPPILWLSLCRNPGWHHVPHGHRIWRHVTRGPLLVQSKSIVSRSVPSSSLSCFQACNLLS